MLNDIVTAPVTVTETAIFICPSCNNRKASDVSKFLSSDQEVKLKVTCTCGYKYVAILERRQKYRKETNLPGTYSIISDGRLNNQELMTVRDISLTGMKLKTNLYKKISIGDIIKVEFHLDNTHRSLIEKKVKVVSINLPYIGTEFILPEDIGKDLGFYLFE